MGRGERFDWGGLGVGGVQWQRDEDGGKIVRPGERTNGLYSNSSNGDGGLGEG